MGLSDSDDEELAALRGSRHDNLASLRARQVRADDESAYYADAAARPRAASAALEDEADDAEFQAGLRAHFPMSFGDVEREPVILESVHAQRARDINGDTSAAISARHAVAGNGSQHAELRGRTAADSLVGPPAPTDDADGTVGPPVPTEDDMVGPPVPAEDAEDMVGPVAPADYNGGVGLGEDDEESDPYSLPISHEASLQGHDRVVSTLDVDPAGSRLLSGSRDYNLHIFDFNGMKSDMRAFRSLKPSEGHPVLGLSWSPTGDAFLSVTGSAKIKVYDRDGIERGESLQGDMYIRDMRNTKGHVSPCTSGQWHPADRFMAMTSSDDGTLRTWDTWTVTQSSVIKPTLARPARTSVTACRYGQDGTLVGAGLMDGTLQLWDAKGQAGSRAAVGQVLPPKAQLLGKQDWRYVSGGGQVARGAHVADTEITSLAFSRDSSTMLSRAADDTLKVWDIRKFKSPVHTVGGLPTLFSTTQCAFSPDERLILTGTSADRHGKGGSLVLIDRQTFQVVRRISMPGSVVAIHWHDRLNQIFVGAGDKTSGAVKVLYSPILSEKGVLSSAARKRRPENPFDFQIPLVIHNPHALPMFREERKQTKRNREKDRQDPQKTQKPDPGPVGGTGPGSGGRIGSTGGTLLTQYILNNHGLLRAPDKEDVRAKILRHEGNADQFKQFTAAYRETQPKPMYAEEEKEEEDE